MRKALALAVGILLPAVSFADDPFWLDVLQPRRREFRSAIAEGQEVYDRAELAERAAMDAVDRRMIGELYAQALVHFERATRVLPDDPLGHLCVGKTLSQRERHADALRAASRARALDEDGTYEEDVAFLLAIELSIAQEWEAALHEYDRALPETVRPDFRATILSNAAEIQMAAGRLPEAIDLYRRAIAEAWSPSQQSLKMRSLAEYGLAIALDRDDRRAEALETMRSAWAHDPNRQDPTRPAGTLTDPGRDGVFFVPEHDLHYYRALLFEARLALPEEADARVTMLEHGANEWQLYLSQGGATGPWARVARDHAASIERQRRRGRSR